VERNARKHPPPTGRFTAQGVCFTAQGCAGKKSGGHVVRRGGEAEAEMEGRREASP
jgi:hypothetical protein